MPLDISAPISILSLQAMPDSRHTHTLDLLDLIAHHFDLEEVRTLCFALGIAYDDLGGEGRRGKARELLLLAGRHDRMADLLALLRRERPAVDWAAAPSPPAPTADPPRAGDSYVIGPATNSYMVVGPGASMVIGRDEPPPDPTT
ncbi:MAG: hypothetical protein KC410_13975 [Anaerolineales bacterium]|uniref:hypothetical protein n=1 Tax=Promineifilum sp. TaxID=2664178 RepID=UPI001D2009C8|nr:hypothetical protein [Anaerolineales bacterium]MCB8936411.1 hypothetical protein [Promineifilum sp.]MCO5182039.1 hypothetical protein [Promineifilum sp.]